MSQSHELLNKLFIYYIVVQYDWSKGKVGMNAIRRKIKLFNGPLVYIVALQT